MPDKDKVKEVKEWFATSVMYGGEPYVMDDEQVKAVVGDDMNTIVVARAGSGKTRTIVAKIVYLIARCGVKPDEIMTFVFNANAATEINERLGKMMVDGVPIVKKVEIASTFHAFSRKIVYDICDGREKCGKILAEEKEEFTLEIVKKMMKEEIWRDRIKRFIYGEMDEEGVMEEEIVRFGGMMAQFINRAQQQYLGGEKTLRENVENYVENNELTEREQVFLEIGTECYNRYHWYLLDKKQKIKLRSPEGVSVSEYGTDFNLIVSWASKLILSKRASVVKLLENKKYVLIDEYQDFSQLFLSAVMSIRSVAKEAKLFVVGDDWQAINRFAGSEVDYFKNFNEYFPDQCRKLEISTNYRCDYLIVDTARKFMKRAMKEKGSFRAFSKKVGKLVLVDSRKTELKYAMVDYDDRVSLEDKRYKQMMKTTMGRSPKKSTVQYLKTLVLLLKENKKAESILLLHRNNDTNIEGISLCKLGEAVKGMTIYLGIMNEEEYDNKVKLMTMHKSKGLEADVVIILEADEGVIPKIHPDARLFRVFGETDNVALDDQKRLFYVAMTRAKKRLYIIHKEVKKRSESGFIKYLGKGVERWKED